MLVTAGDRFKSHLTEKNYNVKLIRDYSVILESEDGSSQVLTNEGNLDLFYERILNGEGNTPGAKSRTENF